LHRVSYITGFAKGIPAADICNNADHTKQSTVSRVRFCEIGQIGTLVADNTSAPAQLDPFRRAGIKVVI